MAASAADIDNDGDLDLYVANFGQDKLYRNNGDGTFTDITEAAGIDNTLWSIAAVYLDFDVDGDLDIFVVNYLVYELSMPVSTYKGIVGYGHPRSYKGDPRRTLPKQRRRHLHEYCRDGRCDKPCRGKRYGSHRLGLRPRWIARYLRRQRHKQKFPIS